MACWTGVGNHLFFYDIGKFLQVLLRRPLFGSLGWRDVFQALCHTDSGKLAWNLKIGSLKGHVLFEGALLWFDAMLVMWGVSSRSVSLACVFDVAAWQATRSPDQRKLLRLP